MKKTHFRVSDTLTACNREVKPGVWATDRLSSVNCLRCTETDAYVNAYIAFKAKQEAAFQAQTPRHIVPLFGRVNDDGVMECYNCQGVLFRERPRSLFSYNFVCEGCGKTTSPPTETGMCT